MRSRYSLIFLTLVLLVVPSISIIVTASGGHPLPNNIRKGDIVLIKWKNTNGAPWYEHFVWWNHAMLYIGKIHGVDRVIHAWYGVENISWDKAISYNDKHGGIRYLGLVRVTYSSGIIRKAITFAQAKNESRCKYDDYSQRVSTRIKQVQPYPDQWWQSKLPPSDYNGDYTDPAVWIDNFTFHYNQHVDGWENGHHVYRYPANDYYCTELVWAAYFNASRGNIYLEKTPDLQAITGMEIWKDNDVLEHPRSDPYSVGNPHPLALDEC